MKFNDGGWTVDASGSGIVGVSGKYGISDVKYSSVNNLLEYKLRYNSIDIGADFSFVLNDVQFYAVEIDFGEQRGGKRINSIYFNEFQNELQARNSEIAITENKFTLDGKEYQIDNGKLKVAATKAETYDGDDVN